MKFDLHIHSHYSYDSLSNLEAILAKAREKGLDGIAITDHDSFNSFNHLAELEAKYSIWIIPGVELTTSMGDILALYLSHPINIRDANQAIDAIHHQGGLAILAHPFKRAIDYKAAIVKKLDAIEQVNSRWLNLLEYKHIPKVEELFALVTGRTAGSDAHFPSEIGNAYLETPWLANKDELRTIICEGRGVPRYTRLTRWQDFLSQCIKFRKKPSYRQGCRLAYYFLRQVLQGNQRRRIG